MKTHNQQTARSRSSVSTVDGRRGTEAGPRVWPPAPAGSTDDLDPPVVIAESHRRLTYVRYVKNRRYDMMQYDMVD